MNKVKTIAFDWKQPVECIADELKPLLLEFGVYVYDDPRTDGSDQIGLILSDKPLTKFQIRNIENY